MECCGNLYRLSVESLICSGGQRAAQREDGGIGKLLTDGRKKIRNFAGGRGKRGFDKFRCEFAGFVQTGDAAAGRGGGRNGGRSRWLPDP